MEFIDVIDLKTEKDGGYNRKVTLVMNEKKSIPNTVRLMGGLSHNAVITFDRQNAKKMRDFCQGILDCYEKKAPAKT